MKPQHHLYLLQRSTSSNWRSTLCYKYRSNWYFCGLFIGHSNQFQASIIMQCNAPQLETIREIPEVSSFGPGTCAPRIRNRMQNGPRRPSRELWTWESLFAHSHWATGTWNTPQSKSHTLRLTCPKTVSSTQFRNQIVDLRITTIALNQNPPPSEIMRPPLDTHFEIWVSCPLPLILKHPSHDVTLLQRL